MVSTTSGPTIVSTTLRGSGEGSLKDVCNGMREIGILKSILYYIVQLIQVRISKTQGKKHPQIFHIFIQF